MLRFVVFWRRASPTVRPRQSRRLYHHSTCRIATTPSGWGVLAQQAWIAGETVLDAHAGTARVLYTQPRPDSHTLQIGPHLHAVLGLPARFLNHSCRANLAVKAIAVVDCIHTLRFVATRDIAKGEELTFDYETTEATMDEPFRCGCGESNCRGLIRGFEHRKNESLVGESSKERAMAHLL